MSIGCGKRGLNQIPAVVAHVADFLMHRPEPKPFIGTGHKQRFEFVFGRRFFPEPLRPVACGIPG